MKNVTTLSIALASIVILSGCGLIRSVPDDSVMQREEGSMMKENPAMIQQKEAMEKNDTMMEKGESMESDDAMMKKDDSAMMQKEDAMMKSDTMVKAGSYTTYSPASVKTALVEKKNVVLFFHAPWCPTCKAADAVFAKTTPPENTVVFKVDYDSNTDLRKKYGVTYQHTFVSLNADESLKKKSSGDKSYADIQELF